MNINHLSCCGVKEITSLRRLDTQADFTPADALFSYCRDAFPIHPQLDRGRYFIFTQAGADDESNPRYGRKFAAFLREANLGEVIDTIPAGVNPNSGNHLRMWIWIANLEAVAEWLNEEVKRRNYVFVPAEPTPIPYTPDLQTTYRQIVERAEANPLRSYINWSVRPTRQR